MSWRGVDYLATQIARHPYLQLPPGYSLDQLSITEVPDLVDSLQAWYPDIAVGSESCHLDPRFYYERVQLRESTDDRVIFPVTIKHQGRILSLINLEKDPDELTIEAKMGVVHPSYRGMGLGYLGPGLLEVMGRGSGAELAYYFTTLKIPHEQIISENLGYRLVGILPASDRQQVRAGKILRVPEAIYAKVLVGDEALFHPPEGALTPATKKFWDFIFKP